MVDYKDSTHAKNWIFTREQLDKEYQKKHLKFRFCVARSAAQQYLRDRQFKSTFSQF